MSAITLQQITHENWQQAIKLTVHEHQRSFVASNLYSIAEAQFYATWVPLAICNAAGTMVGFVMYGTDDEDLPGNWWIIRLMIDQARQQQGYGRAAMAAVLARLKALPDTRHVLLSYEPENEVAAKFYAGLGFEDTGRIEYGEKVVQLMVRD
jgi:diamine N-acetyltransferase